MAISSKFGKDASTNAIEVVDYEHHEIHSGSHYFHHDVHDLSINDVLDYQITTPDTAKWAHMLFSYNTEAETTIYLYEGLLPGDIIVAGSAAPVFNNNRNSTKTSGLTINEIENSSVANANADTDVTANATELWHNSIGSGRDGGATRRGNELILKQNTIYCLRLIATAAGYVNTDFEWYEHTDKS